MGEKKNCQTLLFPNELRRFDTQDSGALSQHSHAGGFSYLEVPFLLINILRILTFFSNSESISALSLATTHPVCQNAGIFPSPWHQTLCFTEARLLPCCGPQPPLVRLRHPPCLAVPSGDTDNIHTPYCLTHCIFILKILHI